MIFKKIINNKQAGVKMEKIGDVYRDESGKTFIKKNPKLDKETEDRIIYQLNAIELAIKKGWPKPSIQYNINMIKRLLGV